MLALTDEELNVRIRLGSPAGATTQRSLPAKRRGRTRMLSGNGSGLDFQSRQDAAARFFTAVGSARRGPHVEVRALKSQSDQRPNGGDGRPGRDGRRVAHRETQSLVDWGMAVSEFRLPDARPAPYDRRCAPIAACNGDRSLIDGPRRGAARHDPPARQ